MTSDHASPDTPPLNDDKLVQVVEALLFVGTAPVHPDLIGQVFPQVSARDVDRAIAALRENYRRQNRPYVIVQRPNEGYRLELVDPYRSELAEKTRGQRSIKLTRSAIDILSVVAYRQPIDKEQVREIVGLDPSSVLRQLVRRGLLTTELSTDAKSVAKYITAPRFLEVFGLESLADVPASDDLERM